ncbi:MAG: lamin tail domain-containing protein [Kiritimatiellae bacterium]|nr:lamin tail domain-containing protein [Kiritimatiellia bacterium]
MIAHRISRILRAAAAPRFAIARSSRISPWNRMMALAVLGMVMGTLSTQAAGTAAVTLRPSHVDISSAASRGAVLMTLSGYTADSAPKYRIYNGGNQHNCWDAVSGTFISASSYASGPLVPGDYVNGTTFWILYERGNNANTAASYRDRVSPYSANNNTAALPSATEIASPFTLTGTLVAGSGYNLTVRYVVLGFDATSGGTLVCASFSDLTTGDFSLVCPGGATLQRIEVRTILNVSITSAARTGSWSADAALGNFPLSLDTSPTITVPEGALEFGNVLTGAVSEEQSYSVSGANLTANIVITPPAGYEISTTSGSGFVAAPGTLTLSPTGGTVNSTPIYVRFAPTAVQAYDGVISHASTGATAKEKTVSGAGVVGATSDIIRDGTFSEPENIPYAGHVEDNLTAASLQVGSFTIRDGGAGATTDGQSTTVTDLGFAVTNGAHLKRLAIYDGNTEIAEAAGGAAVNFAGLAGLAAPDGGSRTFRVLASFNSAVTDNDRLRFTIQSAAANPAGTVFETANAGGAQTDATGDRNRLEVTADRLAFSGLPATCRVGVDFSGTVQAQDANGNLDLDTTASVTLSLASGPPNALSSVDGLVQSLVAGTFSWTDLQLSATGEFTIEAAAAGLIPALSGPIVATLAAPVALEAGDIGMNGFTAQWEAAPNATGYFLDVSTTPFEGDLLISEYVEGGGNNKYIEIFNSTAGAVDLSDYQLQLFTNGAATPGQSVTLSGTIPAGGVVVYKHSSAAAYAGAATANAAVNFNGDDAVALKKISADAYVDIIGRIGEDPGEAWVADPLSTLNQTLVRKSAVAVGVTVNPAAGFPALATEWDTYAQDTVDYLGSHTFTGVVGANYVPGYENLNVGAVTSYAVTGLDPDTTYYYRVRATDGVSVSGNSNMVAARTLSTDPYIALSPADLTAFSTTVGTPSAAQQFTVAGINLTGDITVTAPAGFEVSTTSDSGYGATVTLIPVGGIVAETPVFVRMIGDALGAFSGDVTATSAGATDAAKAVSGTVQLPPPTATAATLVSFDSFTANWTAVAGATGYRLDVIMVQSGGGGGGLFISEVTDPADVANAKFVELFNATNAAIDLAAGNWYVSRQSNGGSTWGDIALTGVIPAGGTYVIANNQTDYEAAFADTADQYNGSISGNGDDGYFLYSGGNHTAGTLVDAYGVVDQDGTGMDWEYLDTHAVRLPAVSTGNTVWTAAEWNIPASPVNVADMTPHAHLLSTFVPGYEDLAVGNATSWPVVGLNPETTYAYRVRAITDTETSPNSNVMEVTTTAQANATVLEQFNALTVNGVVMVRWVTSQEVGTTAFDVYRKNGEIWEKINIFEVLPAGAPGAEYQLFDLGATPGATYEYKLVETTGTGTTEHGPFERETTVLRFTGPAVSLPEGMEIVWASREGESYRVLFCDDLVNDAFDVLADDVAATAPENTFIDDTDPMPSMRVYRIELK